MRPTSSPALQELLGDELDNDPTTVRGLTNHLPMALIAKERLGASDVELKRFAVAYSRNLAPLASAKDRLDHSTWKDAIGNSEKATELRSYFAKCVAENGVDDVLRTHLPTLLPGLGGAGFHGVIRLAYAIEASSPSQIAAGLAYFAEVAKPLAELAPLNATTQEPVEIFTRLSETREWSKPQRARLITEEMHLAAEREGFATSAASLEIDDDSERRLAACALLMFASTNNFTALHGVTGLAACSVVRTWVDDQQLVDRYAFQALLAAYLSIGAPALWSADHRDEFSLSQTFDVSEVRAVAANSDDEHVAKIVYTSLEHFEQTNEPLYLSVAARATSLDNSSND